MEYNIIDKKSYHIHTLKTNRFKQSKIEIFFRVNATKDNLHLYTFLCDLLNHSCKEWPTKRELILKAKDLYNTYFSFRNILIGETVLFYATTTFINPEHIDEKDYLDKVVKSFFSFVLNPNVINNEFDKTAFNVVKNNIIMDIKSIDEDPDRKAMEKAFKLMDEDSISSTSLLGSIDQIEKITPESIYNVYKDIINNSNVDIFVSGNIDMDNIVFLIDKYYKNNYIRTNNYNYFVENKEVRKIQKRVDQDNFDQSQLVCLFNINDVTDYERNIVFWVLNFILGNGGLNCKLYKYIREDNSLCYRISSLYLRYDNILCISSALAYENVEKTIKLIGKAIKEMQKGIFTEEDIIDAKKNMFMSLDIQVKNPWAVLNSLEIKYFTGSYDLEEKRKFLEKVTKEDIIKLAKKIKPNTYYCLREVNHE